MICTLIKWRTRGERQGNDWTARGRYQATSTSTTTTTTSWRVQPGKIVQCPSYSQEKQEAITSLVSPSFLFYGAGIIIKHDWPTWHKLCVCNHIIKKRQFLYRAITGPCTALLYLHNNDDDDDHPPPKSYDPWFLPEKYIYWLSAFINSAVSRFLPIYTYFLITIIPSYLAATFMARRKLRHSLQLGKLDNREKKNPIDSYLMTMTGLISVGEFKPMRNRPASSSGRRGAGQDLFIDVKSCSCEADVFLVSVTTRSLDDLKTSSLVLDRRHKYWISVALISKQQLLNIWQETLQHSSKDSIIFHTWTVR